MLPVQSVIASTIRRTALRIPPIRRLYDDRSQLARALEETRQLVGALQEAHRASVAQLCAVHAEQIAQLSAVHTEQVAQLGALQAQQTAQLNQLAAQLSRTTLDRPLAFMHVPKSSGLAMAQGIREVLPSTPVVHIFDASTFGSFAEFDTMGPDVRRLIHVDGLPSSTVPDFVGGHFAYSTLVGARPNARLMTVLREPRSRLLSLWLFWRTLTDEALRAWGGWSARVALARKPLVEFLASPEVASHTDNIAARLLLWPHPLIPDDDFIPGTADHLLAEEAMARLQTFDFADVLENPELERNVGTFLVRPFVHRRFNETKAPPPEFSVDIDAELSDAALGLLDHRSRLERILWRALCARQMPHADPERLAEDAFARTVARFRALQPGNRPC